MDANTTDATSAGSDRPLGSRGLRSRAAKVADTAFAAQETSAAHFQPFPPLTQESRTAVPTDAAAYYLSRKPQTLRAWACLENGPLRPIRINGRLSWRVADIQAVLAGELAA